MAIWSRLTGAIAGIAIGGAGAAAVEPVLEVPKQQAWKDNPNRILDLGSLARLVAQGLIDQDAVVDEAERNGYGGDKLRAQIQLELKAAPVAELLVLWRRGRISETLVDHGLAKAQIEQQYWTPIKELLSARLDPAVIATAIQRGIMQAPFDLPYNPDVPVGNVTPFPVSDLDTTAEAAASGIDTERLRVETALVGLPMALDRAARAHFRGILTDGDYLRAVLEGNARGEWAEAELAVARQILSPHEYAELELRGYYDRDARLGNTAKHGMSDEDSDWLYDVLGRGLSLHAAFVAERRGGVFEGPTDAIPEWALYQLERGNLRPEVYNLAWAGRETYPSYFVTRALAQAGVIDPERAKALFEGLGWPLDVADAAATFYTAGVTAKADPHLTKAEGQLWSAIHKAYVESAATDAEADSDLATIGVTDTARSEVLALWQAERAVRRRSLAPAEIKKAIGQPGRDQAWAEARLGLLGFSTEDVAAFLAE